jgi:hypothetical protein
MSIIAQTTRVAPEYCLVVKEMDPMTPTKWQTLAAQASVEMDPKKLSALVAQLCGALDEERIGQRHAPLFAMPVAESRPEFPQPRAAS